jgi:TnpA family transposase
VLLGAVTAGKHGTDDMIGGAAVQDFALAYGGKKRTVWFHVANAFSLLVSTMAPIPSNEKIKVISNYDR